MAIRMILTFLMFLMFLMLLMSLMILGFRMILMFLMYLILRLLHRVTDRVSPFQRHRNSLICFVPMQASTFSPPEA